MILSKWNRLIQPSAIEPWKFIPCILSFFNLPIYQFTPIFSSSTSEEIHSFSQSVSQSFIQSFIHSSIHPPFHPSIHPSIHTCPLPGYLWKTPSHPRFCRILAHLAITSYYTIIAPYGIRILRAREGEGEGETDPRLWNIIWDLSKSSSSLIFPLQTQNIFPPRGKTSLIKQTAK